MYLKIKKTHFVFSIILSLIATLVGLAYFNQDLTIYRKASFAELPNWEVQNFAKIRQTFLNNCQQFKRYYKNKELNPKFGTKQQWLTYCNGLKNTTNTKAYIEKLDLVYIWQPFQESSLFTGYYSPLLQGSLKKSDKYPYPLYKRPTDLIEGNLRDFFPEKTDLKYKKIFAKIQNNKLTPYYSRKELENNNILSNKDVLVWVNDKIAAFFLHIQGSGEVQLDNGELIHVGYSAQNGQPYYAIGRYMANNNMISKHNISLQTIKQYLINNPKQRDEILYKNPSFIFFTKKDNGPYGAFNQVLTPEHSVAIDRNFIPLGLPLFISTKINATEQNFNNMVFAQDIGGAINGKIRADIYFGNDNLAAEKSGKQNAGGKMYVFSAKNI